MLNVSGTTRVLVATAPVDLRGSFNRLKVLYWDGSGLWVCAKRLEKGRFTWPGSDQGRVSLRGEEFSALIHGLHVQAKAGWYRR